MSAQVHPITLRTADGVVLQALAYEPATSHTTDPAQAVLLGGNVRVGLEDNLYLDRGVLASNGQLVERASEIITRMGGRVLSPAEGREKMNLKRR